MFYIASASTISHQPTFGHIGFARALQPLGGEHALLAPDYKNYIDAGLLRRMSRILRMSVACAKDCLANGQVSQPDAIVVGTGLGCLQDTEKFLNNTITVEGLLPPTSFIQSTHNTLAGQISLSLGNHAYNMTHTQNTVSFEHALIDALLLLDENGGNVLVGAGDENIDLLETISGNLHIANPNPLTSGTSFFVLTKEKDNQAKAVLTDVSVTARNAGITQSITTFLSANRLSLTEIDLVLFADMSRSESLAAQLVEAGADRETLIDYLPVSGIYPTASAFAVHWAADRIAADTSVRNVLVCNAMLGKNLGLTLLHSIEA